jgi:GNAT superfamily N-acetyltransferase
LSGYRFCRTDDIGLLVGALNRCWAPYFPDEPPITEATFKRSIRDLQVWCSSCMVALSGADPIGVLIGAKRPWGTLVHKIAVHPDHRRQGHGRHLLTSLSSKLAILGPPRIIAEVPDAADAACSLFSAAGYVEEAFLTDYVLEFGETGVEAAQDARLVIPVTVDDLAANGLFAEPHGQVCWGRAIETLTARREEMSGLALASDEHIEACILYLNDGEILWLTSFIEDGGTGLALLFSRLRAQGRNTFRLAKVHPAEVSPAVLEAIGFRAVGRHRLYSAQARAS